MDPKELADLSPYQDMLVKAKPTDDPKNLAAMIMDKVMKGLCIYMILVELLE